MAEKRMFIAAPISESHKETIRAFRNNQEDNYRWIAEQNWHLTLLFIGDFPETYVDPLNDSLEGFFSNQSPIQLTPEAFIFAPKLSKARMIWLRFQETKEFDHLINSLFEWLRAFYASHELGFELALHPRNIPHLTLARFKPFNAYNKAFLNRKDLIKEIPALTVSEAILFESVLAEDGAEYYELGRYDFGVG